ncbi:hypothetical protein P8L62_002165, partial [Acinetobacter baumannii]
DIISMSYLFLSCTELHLRALLRRQTFLLIQTQQLTKLKSYQLYMFIFIKLANYQYKVLTII